MAAAASPFVSQSAKDPASAVARPPLPPDTFRLFDRSMESVVRTPCWNRIAFVPSSVCVVSLSAVVNPMICGVPPYPIQGSPIPEGEDVMVIWIRMPPELDIEGHLQFRFPEPGNAGHGEFRWPRLAGVRREPRAERDGGREREGPRSGRLVPVPKD